MLSIPSVILFVVFILITCHRLLPVRIPIWLTMFLGGMLCILMKQISLQQAFASINWNIIGFLFGVFVLAEALEKSHLTQNLSITVEKYNINLTLLLFLWIMLAAISSAVLMNDTIAILGIPLCMSLARTHNQSSQPWLLALAYAITIGSIPSPIGNPQNLFIALHITHYNPFALFFHHFWLASLINLFILFIFIRLLYNDQFSHKQRGDKNTGLRKTINRNDRITIVSLLLFLLLVSIKVILLMLHHSHLLPFFAIAILSSLPILIFQQERRQRLINMDWGTLLFFIGMFILMQSVWQTGIIQSILNQHLVALQRPAHLMSISIILSQLISNVPTVALLLPWLQQANNHFSGIMALACGSTIAGNFTLIGAASTIIIVQNCQKKKIACFSALRYMAIGIPLGLINATVYWLLL